MHTYSLLVLGCSEVNVLLMKASLSSTSSGGYRRNKISTETHTDMHTCTELVLVLYFRHCHKGNMALSGVGEENWPRE